VVYTQVANIYFVEQLPELAVGKQVIQQVIVKLVVEVLVIVVLLGKVDTEIDLELLFNLDP